MDVKDLCIQQGYVSPECKLDEILIYLLVKEGNNPCIGCNCNCTYARPNCNSFESYFEIERKKQFQKELAELKEKVKRVKKRFSKNTTKVIMNVECGYKEVNVHVMNLETERMYYAEFSDLNYASNIIPSICNKYNIEQILIETNAYGSVLYDMLKNRVDIDIVPMFCTRINLK